MQETRSTRSLVFRLLVAACMLTVATAGFAQTSAAEEGPSATTVVGLNLFGPLVGIYSGTLEFALHEDWSVVVVPTYFNVKGGVLGALFGSADVPEEDYELWSISGALGANYFLTERAPAGLFVGGSVEPGYLFASFKGEAVDPEHVEDTVDVDTFKIGGAVHVGYRALLGAVAITPRAGLAYHYLFDEADGISDKLDRAASSAFTGFSFGWGLDLGIAF